MDRREPAVASRLESTIVVQDLNGQRLSVTSDGDTALVPGGHCKRFILQIRMGGVVSPYPAELGVGSVDGTGEWWSKSAETVAIGHFRVAERRVSISRETGFRIALRDLSICITPYPPPSRGPRVPPKTRRYGHRTELRTEVEPRNDLRPTSASSRSGIVTGPGENTSPSTTCGPDPTRGNPGLRPRPPPVAATANGTFPFENWDTRAR